MIIKKGWFCNLEKLEMRQQIKSEACQLDSNTITETPNREKLEHSNRTKRLSNSNRNTTHPNTTEQTLTETK